MVNRAQFKSAATQAVQNIIKHGDTDIFPFPFENRAFFDKTESIIELIMEYDENFKEYINRFSPLNVSSLTPVTYSGFRWATQIDPIWNSYLLACVLALAPKMEEARIPKNNDVVFSYRYKPDKKTGDLFDRNFGWFQFMRHSMELAKDFEFVVICDISEFYPRLGHHRLENALKQIAGDTPYPKKIMDLLSNFSNTNSFGLPIGGPAARILSEITINQIDHLLIDSGVKFVRFADDYHIFSDTREDAYRNLIFLSEKLFVNQGLALQKSKTRIMTSAEFRTTNPIKNQEEGHLTDENELSGVAHRSSHFLRFSLRFDPYSPTKDEDYDRLKNEIKKFDIIGLLKEELSKSRIHAALARKIVTAIQYLDGATKDDAVISVLDNCDVLYPIFSSVLLMIDDVFDVVSRETKELIIIKIQQMIRSESHIFRVDLHLSYAIRVLSHVGTNDNQALLSQIYDMRSSPLIRRDIILVMARWGQWYWISDLKNKFRTLSGPERRAFIVASYILKDEGNHWRDHIKKELSPFENLILGWAGEKANQKIWSIPL
ncbi:MAG: RNA-directed DNA polymerase [Anaerolineaceae bacterium]|nr:RNA-directed DNA polymerase [Anaerolineaceae bacterium]